jgi:two-component system, NtrC family, response regulator AtoC
MLARDPGAWRGDTDGKATRALAPEQPPGCLPVPRRRPDGAETKVTLVRRCRRTPATKYHDGVWGGTDWPLHDLSPVMQRVYDRAVAAAPTEGRILIAGESGSGKSVLAGRIHQLSARSRQPLYQVSCVLDAEALERELFGSESRALRGVPRTAGVLERAKGGTILLHDVGYLPPVVAVKLMRFLETGAIFRIGGVTPRPIDVRVIATTAVDIEAKIREANGRPEYVLSLIAEHLVVPPLRERRSEIAPLARLFVEEACRDKKRSLLELTPRALASLERYWWPDNILDLRLRVHRSVIVCNADRIDASDLFPQSMLADMWSNEMGDE